MKTHRPSLLFRFLTATAAACLTVPTFAGNPPAAPTTGTTVDTGTASSAGPRLARPDLVPLGFTASYKESNTWHRIYSATVTVANFGTADAADFGCLFGYKVLATDDPVKYPVGHIGYCGFVIFDQGLTVMQIGSETATVAFSLPKSVTKIEVYLVVDRFMDGLSGEGNWEDDTGAQLVGNIAESNEQNNILGPKTYTFLNIKPLSVMPTP